MGGLGTEVVTPDQGHDQHGIGTRVVTPGRGGIVESRLQIDPPIARADGFIDAVVRQHDAFLALDHPNLAAARGVERRLVGQRPCLDVISSHPSGEPLGHLLARRARAGVPLSTAAALYLVRELLSTVRALQSHRSGTFHGALSLDAVVITADQRVVVRDVVFGRALSNVTLAPAAWWQQYGLAVPSTPGIPAFTPLTDQFQHAGLDFSADTGAPIVAAAGGVVITQEYHHQFGNMVEIDHGNQLVTRYAHASKVLVKRGDLVRRGQKIAEVGSTGRSTGAHLHFEVLVQGVPQDPQKFLSAGQQATQKLAALPQRNGGAPTAGR